MQYADGTGDWGFAGYYRELDDLLSSGKVETKTIDVS